MITNTTTLSSKKIKVSDLKIGDTFKTQYGTYKCVRAYWANARNPRYRAMNAVVITSNTENMKVGNLVIGWKHNESVELI